MASSIRRIRDETTPPDPRGGEVPEPQHLFERHRALLEASTSAPVRRRRRTRGRLPTLGRLVVPIAAVLGGAVVLAALIGLAGGRADPLVDLRHDLIPGGVEAASPASAGDGGTGAAAPAGGYDALGDGSGPRPPND
ncbi:MAG TPA: hypothetical protein VHG51_04615 [Longimicrobiaceae bacterium]|nr:hypothetical protein [Longimicrobiaceae bacterium]